MGKSYRACTVVARNYLAQAQVLVASFEKHNPDVDFFTLVIDGSEEDRQQPSVGTVVLPHEIGLDPVVLHEMIAMYDVMELATALKPSLLMWLLRKGSTAAAYFDPDIRVYAPLDEVFDGAAKHEILLTPHTLDPVPRDGRLLTENIIMQAGIYNLGFIAVGAAAYRFLSWWHERLKTDAIVDVANGLFTDQRWIDWVPSLFAHTISRNRGLNAAYWNLHEREIDWRDGSWYAGGDLLKFFHFSGYDPEKPWLLSKHMGDRPRTVLSEHRMLRELCAEYRDELVEAGHPELRRNPYRLNDLPNGSHLDATLRRVYRDVILGHLKVALPPPDPIDDADEFVTWMLRPMFVGSLDSLSVAEYGIWRARPDLQSHFPDVLGTHGKLYREWLEGDPGTRKTFARLTQQERTGPDTSSPRRRLPTTAPNSFGWSVIAYATSELGVGEAGRRMASAVAQTGLPTDTVAVPLGNLSRQKHRPSSPVYDNVRYDNAIVCVNADQVARLDEVMGLGRLGGARVGLWFWELSEFPERFSSAFDVFHEVWVASEFNRATIQAATDKTVRTVKLPIVLPTAPTRFTRRALGIPADKHVFLTNFDYLSIYRRKNPTGTIRAYLDAFSPDDGAVLIVKSINGHLRPLDVEHVRSVAEGRPDVLFVDDYFSAAAMRAAIELSDTYVSLHRSEGYGLNMADAMAHGTPVVATGYSGNMDFMTPETAELVGYDLVAVGPGNEPYDPRAAWADPDLHAASTAMRRLFDDPAGAQALADRAAEHARTHFSLEGVGRSVAAQLLALSNGSKEHH